MFYSVKCVAGLSSQRLQHNSSIPPRIGLVLLYSPNGSFVVCRNAFLNHKEPSPYFQASFKRTKSKNGQSNSKRLWHLEHESSFNGCPNVYTFSSPTRSTSVNILVKCYRERKGKVIKKKKKLTDLCMLPEHEI